MFHGAAQRRASGIHRRDRIRHLRFSTRLGSLANTSATKEVYAAVMGDPKQPRFQSLLIVERVELPVGGEQRLLHNVLSVRHRSSHACTVSVQARPQMGDRLEEGQVARLEYAGVRRTVAVVHTYEYAVKCS